MVAMPGVDCAVFVCESDAEFPSDTDLTAMQRLDALVILPLKLQDMRARIFSAPITLLNLELPREAKCGGAKSNDFGRFLKQDFLGVVEGLEEEFSRNFAGQTAAVTAIAGFGRVDDAKRKSDQCHLR
jgi:hypothetical protein